MTNPLIAIVGSVVESREDYEPPLRSGADAPAACKELGRALAEAEYRLIVYSGGCDYIESYVVSGYIESGRAQRDSIQIRYPNGEGTPRFTEEDTHAAIFDSRPDAYENWQVSFYSSLKDADGILVLGGGPSALVAGIIAQSLEKPIVAVSTFGGSAETVWRLLQGGRLASDSEWNTMGAATWAGDAAATLVGSLDNQLEKLREEQLLRRQADQQERRAISRQAVTTGVFFLAALAFMALGTFLPDPRPILFAAFFLGTPLLAGSAGGLARDLLDADAQQRRVAPRVMLSVVLGMLAGVLAALLFVVAQWASNPEIKNLAEAIPPGLQLLVPFELLIGFIAGLTLQPVFAKLRETDVVDTGVVRAKRPS